MEFVRAQAVLGKMATKRATAVAGAGGGRILCPGNGGKALGAKIFVSAQETEYMGYTLDSSALQHAPTSQL